MQKQWIDPSQIYVHGVLNNREVNQNYIADLAESMTDKGFLPEFPIDVFRSENLANIETDLPFVCACGAHRTLGAINAKLESVLVQVHDGLEEAFIEMMHLDNFKFDPAQNSGIGQPFTQKEKRAAVTQLLLLPKFFEQTNTALEEELRIPQTSIRRWRSEVVELLETDSPKLRLYGISDGRLARLRELANSQERKDTEGKVVQIRKPTAEATEDEKRSFYEQIEKDWKAAWHIDFSYLQHHLIAVYKLESRWRQYEDLTMPQMQKIHAAILSKDRELFDAVNVFAMKAEEETRNRKAFSDAHESFVRQFKKVLAPGMGEYDEGYKYVARHFERHLSEIDEYKEVRVRMWDYDDLREDLDFMAGHTEVLKKLRDEIEANAESVVAFIERMKKLNEANRNKANREWEKNRTALKEAIGAYPRDISEDAMLSAMESNWNYQFDSGELRFLIDAEGPSSRKNLETVKKEAEYFKKGADAITKDDDWVKVIPVPKKLAEILIEDASESEPLAELSTVELFEAIKARYPLDTRVVDEKRHDAKMNALASLSSLAVETRIWTLSELGVHFAKILDGK